MKETKPDNETGAVDLNRCPSKIWLKTKKCYCGRCAVCGFTKHSAVHGPAYGEPPGSKPYDHQFVPEEK